MAQSGFDDALVLILDNSGGLFLGRREEGGATTLEEIVAMPPGKSTTRLFQSLLPFLGLGPLDWQQAVAMAPHGDPAVFRPLFRNLYELLPDGDYNLRLERVGQLVGKVEPRGKEGPASSTGTWPRRSRRPWKEITLHVLRHHREAAGRRNLVWPAASWRTARPTGRCSFRPLRLASSSTPR